MSRDTQASSPPVDLSIIIVSWKTCDLLRDCLQSIHEHTHRYTYEIWVVDNNSNDGTVEMVQEEFPEVNLIANQDNRGFAKANNQAFVQGNSRYVVALNPDTQLLNDAFDQMLDFLEQSPGYGAAGPKLISRNGQPQLASARYVTPPLMDDIKLMFGLRRLIKPPYDFERDADVEAISGACVMVPRKLLEKQNYLFSEDYFMYGEDLELCWQIGQYGYKIRYVASAHIFHEHDASSRQNKYMTKESMFALYKLRWNTIGSVPAILTRLIIIPFSLSRIFKGILFSMRPKYRHKGKVYWQEYTDTLLWALGLRRRAKTK